MTGYEFSCRTEGQAVELHNCRRVEIVHFSIHGHHERKMLMFHIITHVHNT